MQEYNEFILQFNNDGYIVEDNTLILLKNVKDDTRTIIKTQEYLKLSEELKNKFILENIGN